MQIRPIQLQGFARIALEPGQTKTVTTRLYVEQFGYYSHENNIRQWNVAPGTYTIKVGASSADIRLQQQVLLRGNTTSKPLRDHYFSESIVSQ
jgi:beta-glucosidase